MNSFEKHRFSVLDSWRGLCALCVAAFHFRNNVESHIGSLSFFTDSYLFVDFFFVLSGFVIFANYEKKLREGYSFWKFMLLRFGRLYPLHLFVLLGLIGLEVLQMAVPQLQHYASYGPFQGPDSKLSLIPPNLFLVHAMGITERLSFNGPSWSIGAEFYAYAFFALLIIFFRRHVSWSLPVVALGAGLFLFRDDIYLTTTFKYGFIRCLYGFSIGAFTWRIFDRYQGIIKTKLKFWNVLEAGLCAIMIAGVTLSGTGPMTMGMPILFAAVVLLFSFENGMISRALKKKPFLILGALSYSIYMLHAPIAAKFDIILNIFNLHKSSVWIGDLILLAFLALTVLASLLTYHLIEMPGRNYFRKLAGRTSQP